MAAMGVKRLANIIGKALIGLCARVHVRVRARDVTHMCIQG